MDSVAGLRAEVKRLERNARAKMRRLEKAGIRIAGSGESPLKNSRFYNSRQLKAYIDRLTMFNGRGNKYVAGHNGVPISHATYSRYRAAIKAHNEELAKETAPYDDIVLPSIGQSIRERRAMRRPQHRATGATMEYYEIVEKAPRQFMSDEAMQKMTDSIKKRTKRGVFNINYDQHRKELMDLVNMSGDSELIEAAKDLTPEQFKLLWYNTNFADALSLIYQHMIKLIGGSPSDWLEDVAHGMMNRAKALIKEAKERI